jgi:trimeric autotransporter adhesin
MKKVLLALMLLPCLSNGQTISTFAGTGVLGYTGDGGPATAAKIAYPNGAAFDAAGNVYISESWNNVIRKISPSSILTTVVGTGIAGYSGDGGPATAARLNNPYKVIIDKSGNLLIADFSNHAVRKVTPAGIISTIVGTGGVSGFSGDGGPATAAKLFQVADIAIDKSDNLYIVDYINYRIRKVTTAGTISTYAGNGTTGSGGDGGPATAAQLWFPYGAACDASDNLYIADAYNNKIRKVSTSGIITTVAGTGTPGYGGDGGPATAADLFNPASIAFDAGGNMYIADDLNHRIRKVSTSGTISTYAGTGVNGFSGDGGPATAAKLWAPRDVRISPSGNMFISDDSNHRMRVITMLPLGQPVLSSESIHIYPNPVNEMLVIESPVALKGSSISIINTLGQVLTEQKTEKGVNSFDLHAQPAGMYIVKFVNNGSTLYQKVIKK